MVNQVERFVEIYDKFKKGIDNIREVLQEAGIETRPNDGFEAISATVHDAVKEEIIGEPVGKVVVLDGESLKPFYTIPTINCEAGKAYKISGTYGTNRQPFSAYNTAMSMEPQGLPDNSAVFTYINTEKGNVLTQVYDKMEFALKNKTVMELPTLGGDYTIDFIFIDKCSVSGMGLISLDDNSTAIMPIQTGGSDGGRDSIKNLVIDSVVDNTTGVNILPSILQFPAIWENPIANCTTMNLEAGKTYTISGYMGAEDIDAYQVGTAFSIEATACDVGYSSIAEGGAPIVNNSAATLMLQGDCIEYPFAIKKIEPADVLVAIDNSLEYNPNLMGGGGYIRDVDGYSIGDVESGKKYILHYAIGGEPSSVECYINKTDVDGTEFYSISMFDKANAEQTVTIREEGTNSLWLMATFGARLGDLLSGVPESFAGASFGLVLDSERSDITDIPKVEVFALEPYVKAKSKASSGDGVVEILTPEDMNAFKVSDNVDKYIKYSGVTTEEYINNDIYQVRQEGGSIVLFKGAPNFEGAYMKTYDVPLNNNLKNGEKVNILFKIDGGEIKQYQATIYSEEGMPMIGIEGGNPSIIYQDENVAYVFAGYLTYNMNTGEPGQSYLAMAMPMNTTELSTDEEVEAFKTEENVGKFIDFRGTDSENYKYDTIYSVMKKGGAIVVAPNEIDLEIVAFEGISKNLISEPIRITYEDTSIYSCDVSIAAIGLEADKTYLVTGQYGVKDSNGSWNDSNNFSLPLKAVDYFDWIVENHAQAEGWDAEMLEELESKTKGVVCFIPESKLEVELNGEAGYYGIEIFDNAVDGGDIPNYDSNMCWVHISRDGVAFSPFTITSIQELQEATNSGEVYATFDNTTERVVLGGKLEGYLKYAENFKFTNIASGSKAILYYTVDGVEKSLECYVHYRELEGVGIYAFSKFESAGAELTVGLIDDSDNSVWLGAYMGVNYSITADGTETFEAAEGTTFQFMIWNTRTIDIPRVEFLGARVVLASLVELPEEEREKLSMPISYEFTHYVNLPVTSEPIATASEIKAGYQAYGKDGVMIDGELQNPPAISTQEEFDNLTNTAGHMDVYWLEQSEKIDGYFGGYVGCFDYSGERVIMPMYKLNDIISGGMCWWTPTLRINKYSSITKPYCFYNEGDLKKVIFESDYSANISHHAFCGCHNLSVVIINGTGAVGTGGEGMFEGTPIADGSGYIYVPDALIEEYKVAEYWSMYAAQFRPLSEYVEEA